MTVYGYDYDQVGRCPNCGGLKESICGKCGGTGRNHSNYEPCDRCKGRGREWCHYCGGSGQALRIPDWW